MGTESGFISTIRGVMAQVPRAVAITEGSEEWTYDVLQRKSDLVAFSLDSNNIPRGSVVAMYLPRCADAIAVMLGIMASGRVYLPLDPSYPPSRLKFMMDQADVVAVISEKREPSFYDDKRVWIPVPKGTGPELNQEPVRSQVIPLAPEDRAYILFTSGSTGKPKGVCITHGNVTAFMAWAVSVLEMTEHDSSATSTSFSFDLCFIELLVPLSVGGTVHVIPHALALGELSRPVSFVVSTPTIASELLEAGLLPRLKVLLSGGEALAPDVATRLLSSGRVGRLLNIYGPTECTVSVTVAEVTAPVPGVIPIGQSVSGSAVFVLDEHGERVADGQVGEICISGRQVASEYVNNASATADRFVVAANLGYAPLRYYRTGDLGYCRDGVLYYLGRADRQVKFNGHRIELGEIDALLRSHPQVSDARTVVQDRKHLVAYVVPSHVNVSVDVANLREYLAESLPSFMRPAGVVVLAEFPKTVSGKLDEASLPRWSQGRGSQETLEVDQHMAQIIKIAAEVTGFTGQIQPTDDFINDLGGTSLGIVRALAQIDHDSGRRLRMSDALADTSIAGLANLLRGTASSSLPADFAFHPEGRSDPIFLFHAYLGGMLKFRRMAELFPSDRPVYGIQVSTDGRQIEGLALNSLTEDAAKRVCAIKSTGRVTLIGHSAGGLFALEVARKLIEAGAPEPRVVLVDTIRLRSSIGYYWGELLSNFLYAGDTPLSERFGRLRSAIRRRLSVRIPQAEDLLSFAERDEVSTNNLIMRHRIQSYGGAVTVMRTRHGQIMAFGRKDLGWAPVVKGSFQVVEVPGAHVSVLDPPHVHALVQRTMQCITEGPHLRGPS